MPSGLLDIAIALDIVSSIREIRSEEETTMNTKVPTTEELQAQVITAVRKGQQTTLEMIKSIVEAVSSATSKLPSAPAHLSAPFTDRLPKAEAVVSGAYDFAGKLLAEQRKFTQEIVKATAALRPGAAKTETAAQAEPGEARDAAGDAEPAE
jgi:valyl-tRNA synthetase